MHVSYWLPPHLLRFTLSISATYTFLTPLNCIGLFTDKVYAMAYSNNNVLDNKKLNPPLSKCYTEARLVDKWLKKERQEQRKT